MNQQAILRPPTIERIFRHLVDGMGYHDAESIPVEDVFKIFEAFFKYEHEWNSRNSQLLADLQATLPIPTILTQGTK